MAPTLSKSEVNYREAKGSQYCGNCSMYKKLFSYDGECTLVKGNIYKYDLCDRWQANER